MYIIYQLYTYVYAACVFINVLIYSPQEMPTKWTDIEYSYNQRIYIYISFILVHQLSSCGVQA